MTDLKPCPFCGGTAVAQEAIKRDQNVPHDITHSGWFVGCIHDCAVVPDRPYRTFESAIASWNKRSNRND